MPPAFALSQDQTLRFIMMPDATYQNGQTPIRTRPMNSFSGAPPTGAGRTTVSNTAYCVSLERLRQTAPQTIKPDHAAQGSTPNQQNPAKPLPPICTFPHKSAKGRRQRIPSIIFCCQRTKPAQPAEPHKAPASQTSPPLSSRPSKLVNPEAFCKRFLAGRRGGGGFRRSRRQGQHPKSRLG